MKDEEIRACLARCLVAARDDLGAWGELVRKSVTRAQEELDAMQKAISGDHSQLVAHLKEIEWAGEIQGDECCPACGKRESDWTAGTGRIERRVHESDCWLARAIGGDNA